MKVLLVWEEIPTSAKLFVLDLNPEDIKRIGNCHYKFINDGESVTSRKDVEDLMWLHDLIDGKDPIDSYDKPLNLKRMFSEESVVLVISGLIR